MNALAFLKGVGQGGVIILLITVPAAAVFLLLQSISQVPFVAVVYASISAILAYEFIARPVLERFETDPASGEPRGIHWRGFLLGLLMVLTLLCGGFGWVIGTLF